ncbi:MAG TPA: squalene/phytoene synthase family protein [Roseiflexaceae bacterium]|nr:squalene/phytoene synthase family protein [Roseiflexaceae bacterium]
MSLNHAHGWAMRPFAEQEAHLREASALLASLRHHAGQDGQEHAARPVVQRTYSLPEAYAHCAAITRANSRSFYLSTRLLPPEKRRAVRALYAFCRTSDDIVDGHEPHAARTLARWVTQVHAPCAPPDSPVLLAWNDTAARYQVPRALVNELLAGIAMDLTVNRYATFDELRLYCYRVASVVGLIAMQIIGHQAGAQPYAEQLGVALQLTNILRDIGEDARRGRVYLPLEDLARFGLSDADILVGRVDGRFRALMRFEIARAQRLYEEAWPGVALLSADGRLAIGAAAEIYRAILGRIAANGFDVFGRRAYVPLAEKLLILWRVWRRVRRL